jgi:hypothetical protein
MKILQTAAFTLALAGALLASGGLRAADADPVDHSAHQPAPEPEQAQAPAQAKTAAPDLQTLRQRMAEMRATQDPARRMQLMEAQMKDMEAMLKDPGMACPMGGRQGGMKGGHGSMGMMGDHGGMGMKGGHGGMGMMGKNMHRQNDLLEKRLDMLEKRLDLMQMLMQKSMGN